MFILLGHGLIDGALEVSDKVSAREIARSPKGYDCVNGGRAFFPEIDELGVWVCDVDVTGRHVMPAFRVDKFCKADFILGRIERDGML